MTQAAEQERAQVLATIAEQMVRYDISFPDLAHAMEYVRVHPDAKAAPASGRPGVGDVAMRLFSTLGGIFIFSGIGVYISMFWAEMNSAMRIIITLGVGLVLHALVIMALKREFYVRSVKPLLLIAAVLQTTGWFVALDELLPHGNDPRYAVLFVMIVMCVQQGTAFFRHRLTMLLFGTLFFGYATLFTLCDLLDANDKLVMIGFGISMMGMAQAIRPTPHAGLSGMMYFIGGSAFCVGLFELMRGTDIEILYLGGICGLIYVSTIVRSSALLTVSTIAMLAYIGYFTENHFVNSVGWPLSLVLLGITFFAISIFMLRLKRRYIR
jgi:hypothetical protein